MQGLSSASENDGNCARTVFCPLISGENGKLQRFRWEKRNIRSNIQCIHTGNSWKFNTQPTSTDKTMVFHKETYGYIWAMSGKKASQTCYPHWLTVNLNVSNFVALITTFIGYINLHSYLHLLMVNKWNLSGNGTLQWKSHQFCRPCSH